MQMFSNAPEWKSPHISGMMAAIEALGPPQKPMYVQRLPDFAEMERSVEYRWRRVDRMAWRKVAVSVKVRNPDWSCRVFTIRGRYHDTTYCGSVAYAELLKRVPEVAGMKNPHPGGIDPREMTDAWRDNLLSSGFNPRQFIVEESLGFSAKPWRLYAVPIL